MKFFIVLLAVVAAVCAEEMASESMKTKRGLHLSLGHSYVAPAPVVAHAAPLVAAPVYTKTYVSHAPVVHHAPLVHHAPIVHHAPAYAAYHAPALAAYHAPAYHAPALAAYHAPVYSAFHRR